MVAATLALPLQSADLGGANLTGVNMNDAASVAEARLDRTQGLDDNIRRQMQERSAVLSVQQNPLSEQENFESSRWLHDARLDINYRYLDLEEAMKTLQSAFTYLENNFDDTQELRIITDKQIDSIREFIDEFRQNLNRFKADIESSRKQLSSLFETMSVQELHKWTDEQLLNELKTLHKGVCDLRDYTALVITVANSVLLLGDEDSHIPTDQRDTEVEKIMDLLRSIVI